MKLLLRIFITAVLVMLLSYLVSGVRVSGMFISLMVAIVLALLNLFIKPLIVLLTLPVTVVTLGLFLLVINALMIWLCSYLVPGFSIDSFLTALIFSILLSLSQSILYRLTGEDK